MTSRYGKQHGVRAKPQAVDRRKQWKQYKNAENWIINTAIEAASEHRWFDAEILLPCIAIRSQPVTPADFLFKLMHIVLVNTHHDTSELDQYFMRNSVVLGANHFELSLTALAEEIIGGTQEEVDSLLELVDDFYAKYSRATKSKVHQPLPEQEHWQALVWSYKGIVLFSRWKSMKKEKKSFPRTMNISGMDSQVTDVSSQMLSQISASSGTQSSTALVQEAYAALHKAVEKSQPCEWLLGPYLELKKDLESENSVLVFLQEYVNKFVNHLPAYLFAYHFLKNNITGSEEVQRVALQGISRMNPANPLVLTYVKDLFKLVTHSHIVQGNIEMSTEDSGLEDEDADTVSSGQENSAKERNYNPNCFLRREKVVEILITCIRKIKNLIEYKQWHWSLEPWRILTNIFRKIHMALICCWYCPSCIIIRKKITYLSRRVLNFWRITFWTTLPSTLTKSVAEVLMHSAYASYMFNYGASFVYTVTKRLHPEFSEFAEELNKLINIKGRFAAKHMEYRSKKANLLSTRSTSIWSTASYSSIQELSAAGKEAEVGHTGMVKENTGFPEMVDSSARERLRLLENRLTGSLQTHRKSSQRQERLETRRACVHEHNKTLSLPGQSPVISRFTPLLSDDSSDFQPWKKKLKTIGPEKCKGKKEKKVKNKKQGHYNQGVKENSKSTKSISAELTAARVGVHKTDRKATHQQSEHLLLKQKNQGSQNKENNTSATHSECYSRNLLDYSLNAKEQMLENVLGNQEVFHDEHLLIEKDNLIVRDSEKLGYIEEENDVIVCGQSEAMRTTSPSGISSTDPLCSNAVGTEENVHSGYFHFPHFLEPLQKKQNGSITTSAQVISENVTSFDGPVISDKDCIYVDDHEYEGKMNKEIPVNDVFSRNIEKSMEMECDINSVCNKKTSHSLSLNMGSAYGEDDSHNINSREVSDDEVLASSQSYNISLSPKLSQYTGSRGRQSVESIPPGTNMNVMTTVNDSQPFPSCSLRQFRADMKDFDHSTPVERACKKPASAIPLHLPSYAELAGDDECEVETEELEYNIISNNEGCAVAPCSQAFAVLSCQNKQTDSNKFVEVKSKSVPKCNEYKKSEVVQSKSSWGDFDFSDLPFPFEKENKETSNKKMCPENSEGLDSCLITLDQSRNLHCERKVKRKKEKRKIVKKNKSKPKDNYSNQISDCPLVSDLTVSDENTKRCFKATSVGENSEVSVEVSLMKSVAKDKEVRNKSKTDKAGRLQDLESKIGEKCKHGKSEKKCGKNKQVHHEPTKEISKCFNDNDGPGSMSNKQRENQSKNTNLGGMGIDMLLEMKDKKKSKSKVKYIQPECDIGVVFSENMKVITNVSGESEKTKLKGVSAARSSALVSDVEKRDKKAKKKIRKINPLSGDDLMPSGKGQSENMKSEKQKCVRITEEINEVSVNPCECEEICTSVININEAVNMNSEQIMSKKVKKKSSKIHKDDISYNEGKSTKKNEEQNPAVVSKGEGRCAETEALSHKKSVQSHLQCISDNEIKSKQKGYLNMDHQFPENSRITDRDKKKKKSELKPSRESKAKKAECSSLAESANQKMIALPKSKRIKEDLTSKAVTKKSWYENEYFLDLPFPFPT